MHVSTSVDYWEEVGEKFYNKYKNIRKLHTQWKQQVSRGQNIVGPSGREWKFKQKENFRGQMEWPTNQIINFCVQGTGADVMMLARLSFAARLKKMNLPEVKLLSTVHDSIVLDTISEHVPRLVNLFHEVFDDLPKNIAKCWGYSWKTPLSCEVSVGYNMGNTEEMKRTF